LSPNYFLRWLFLIVSSLYFLRSALTPQSWHVIDGVDLIIHESGHFIFWIMGEFGGFLGGTLMQLLVPLLLFVYFAVRKESVSVSFVILWLGQNFVNISVYIKDAIDMSLPLVGGGTHDWNYMLSEMEMLPLAPVLGELVYISGLLIIIVGILFGFLSLTREYQQRFDIVIREGDRISNFTQP